MHVSIIVTCICSWNIHWPAWTPIRIKRKLITLKKATFELWAPLSPCKIYPRNGKSWFGCITNVYCSEPHWAIAVAYLKLPCSVLNGLSTLMSLLRGCLTPLVALPCCESPSYQRREGDETSWFQPVPISPKHRTHPLGWGGLGPHLGQDAALICTACWRHVMSIGALWPIVLSFGVGNASKTFKN